MNRQFDSTWSIAVLTILVLAVLTVSSESCGRQPNATYDVVIYGGGRRGCTSQAHGQVGHSRLSGESSWGLSSGGLGWTDSGATEVIGGLARDFYHRVWRHYQKPEAWPWQKPEDYGSLSHGTRAIDNERRSMWAFEPHAAERVFEDLIAEHGVEVLRDECWTAKTALK